MYSKVNVSIKRAHAIDCRRIKPACDTLYVLLNFFLVRFTMLDFTLYLLLNITLFNLDFTFKHIQIFSALGKKLFN